MKNILILSALLWTHGAVAQTDQSTDAQEGFTAIVEDAAGVMMKVPINSVGEENTAAAEMRLVPQEVDVADAEEAAVVFEEAMSLDDVPEIEDEQIIDGSTWGWYGYRNYGYRYYAPAYYYASYRPTYYSYGSYYSYRAPVYYSNRYYRYYYYGWY